jgi:hypothetical protein
VEKKRETVHPFLNSNTALKSLPQPHRWDDSCGTSKMCHEYLQSVLRIRIHMFFGLPDPDPLVRCMDPDPALDPDPSIMQK